jgi:hypothetical protein
VQNMAQSTRQTFGAPSQGVLIESSVVRLSEARYAFETRLLELEQQFEAKAAKVREEYLAAVLEIHACEANGNHAGGGPDRQIRGCVSTGVFAGQSGAQPGDASYRFKALKVPGGIRNRKRGRGTTKALWS